MFVTAMKTPEMKPKLDKQGLIPVNLCGAGFGDFLRDIISDYGRIIDQAGIKVGN
jgi:tripartite-type tricarboxylate transporter receptor subunit TctC